MPTVSKLSTFTAWLNQLVRLGRKRKWVYIYIYIYTHVILVHIYIYISDGPNICSEYSRVFFTVCIRMYEY